MTYPHAPYEHPGSLVPRLAEPFGPFDNLLDVGGGGGIVGYGVWKIVNFSVIDAFPPATAVPNFRLGNGLDIVEIYGQKSFDVVQCCEVIEHLPKVDGKPLLRAMEAVARRLVILTTPYGYSHQDPETDPNEPWANNPYQKHLCGWLPEEFVELGYSIFLNGGLSASQVIAYKDMRDAQS